MTSSASLRWLFLDLDSYFASCEQQARPALRGKPVGVVPLMADTTCCLAASYEAKKYGVKTGTRVADARLLCPAIVLVLARHDLYTLYHRMIVEAVNTCLPIDSILSIDEMIGELAGSQREPSNALTLAEKIKTTLRQRVGEHLTCSIGVAPNRFLAKVASDMNKPNGLTLLREKDLPQALYPLALQDLPGIGPRMERRLREHGILTVQALCALPSREMIALWGGVVGGRFYHWLRGEDITLPQTIHCRLGHQHVLEPALRTPEGAWIIAKKLLVKAAVRLRREGYYTRRLTLHLSLAGESFWEKDAKVEETQDTLTLLAVLRQIWAARPKGKPLRVGITLLDLVPRNRHQLSLLANHRRENLGEAMDLLNAKFGKETLSVGGLFEHRRAVSARISFQRVPDLDEF